jgi:hypothetical protein
MKTWMPPSPSVALISNFRRASFSFTTARSAVASLGLPPRSGNGPAATAIPVAAVATSPVIVTSTCFLAIRISSLLVSSFGWNVGGADERAMSVALGGGCCGRGHGSHGNARGSAAA